MSPFNLRLPWAWRGGRQAGRSVSFHILCKSNIANGGQTLTELTNRFWDPLCRQLLDLYSGTVFLGTPHPSRGQKEEWLKLSLILWASSKFSKALLAQAEIEAAVVANLSEKFQQANMNEPIVSVYETQRTKIPEGLFKSKKEIVSICFLVVKHVLNLDSWFMRPSQILAPDTKFRSHQTQTISKWRRLSKEHSFITR